MLQFESAFKYSAIGMAIVSLKGEWLKVNKSIVKMLGYSEDEFLQLDFQTITHPDDLEKDLRKVEELASGKIESYQMEKRYIHKNGNLIWGRLSVSLARTKNGEPCYFISQIEDITEHKLLMAELEEKNESLALVFSSIYDGYWDWDLASESNHMYMSPHFWGMFGFEPDEKRSSADEWQKIIFDEDLPLFLESLKRHIQSKGKTPLDQEVRCKHRNGSTVWVMCRGKVIEWSKEGEALRMVGTHTDISELRRAQIAVAQNTKFTALGSMAAGISHETNNPLAIIGATVDWMSRKIERNDVQPEKFNEKVDVIQRAIHRISGLIEGLRDYSDNSDNTKKEVISLESVLGLTFSLCGGRLKSRGVSVIKEYDENIKILGNKTQLAQVFFNLIINSLDAIEGADDRWIKIKSERHGDQLRVYFIDSGLGIASHLQDKVMEPLMTTKPQGTAIGMGLSVSKGLIESHGGSFTYCADVGNTAFLIQLPVESEKLTYSL